ncbi:MAG: hypothetical protein D6815_04255 [Candidatus Dadabacteria bacterium]|nr:MAG: hypothetical protein D6815_04255 [Candidatus Dadabacteria bacterium]
MDWPSATRVCVFAFLVAAGAWASYWSRIKAHAVPRRPLVHQGAMILALVLAASGLARGPGWLGAVAATGAVAAAAVFLVSTLTSRLPAKPLAVAIGQPAPRFQATDSEGKPFDSQVLAGRPYVLKFFRGHW